MTRKGTIVAVDPDTEKSGVAFLRPGTRMLEAAGMTFPQLLDFLLACKEESGRSGEPLTVVVEAGWLVQKSNFHGQSGRRAERIAKNVGANHETGRKIVEMCRHYGIDVVEKHPLKKIWKGRDGKITAKELESLTGLSGRTSQDMRDAALLAWDFAGLPAWTREEMP